MERRRNSRCSHASPITASSRSPPVRIYSHVWFLCVCQDTEYNTNDFNWLTLRNINDRAVKNQLYVFIGNNCDSAATCDAQGFHPNGGRRRERREREQVSLNTCASAVTPSLFHLTSVSFLDIFDASRLSLHLCVSRRSAEILFRRWVGEQELVSTEDNPWSRDLLLLFRVSEVPVSALLFLLVGQAKRRNAVIFTGCSFIS